MYRAAVTGTLGAVDEIELAESVVRGHVGFLGEGPMGQDRFALPSGTVTFLLTDIEGSSRRWEADPGSMAPAVGRHYAILDDAVARWGGVRPVEQGEGDSIVAAFARATDAVAAAVEAQRRLTAELGDVFAVRMALHTGEAQLRDEGNYFGDAVNRCARVRACAYGGQIVCTRTVVDLVADRLPVDAVLTDLGRHRLRDLGRPEQIWQLVAEGLRASFPPLRSLDAFRHNLPVALSSFVGRASEVAELRSLLVRDGVRLVTLAGAGGCGKTRLALRLAGETVDRYPGGAWWTELAMAQHEGEVAPAVLRAVGLREEADRPALDVIATALTDEPRLVILDNCEHLLDDVAAVADELLRRCPGLVVLATSREPLGVPGEIVWRVPSLPTPAQAGEQGRPVPLDRLTQLESVRLFLERAHQARPNFSLTEQNAPSVAQICARLDGIPLAIELAAARCRTLTPERIAEELDDRFRLLTGGARTATPRQQTLLASVDWSHELLDRAERAVFRRLGAFVGSFTLDAAEAVCADGELVTAMDVFDLVTRLVDKSLAAEADANAGEVRYRLLETIRQYALDRCLAAGELESTRDRHLDWCLAATRDLDRTRHAQERLLADYANVRAALVWSRGRPQQALELAAAVAHTIGLLDRYDDATSLLLPIVQLGRDEFPGTWARAVAAVVDPVSFAGEYAILDLLDDAEAIARAERDGGSVANILSIKGMADLSPDSLARWEEGARLGREAGWLSGEYCAALLAQAHLATGHLRDGWQEEMSRALRRLDEVLASPSLRAQWAFHLTFQPFLLGDLSTARTEIETAVAAATGHAIDPTSRSFLVSTLAYLALVTGDRELGERAAAIEGAHRGRWGSFVAANHITLANHCRALADGSAAAEEHHEGMQYGWMSDVNFAAAVHGRPGEPPRAVVPPVVFLGPYASCRQALQQAQLAALATDASDEAEDLVHASLVIAHEHGYRPSIVECLETLAALNHDRVVWSRLLGASESVRSEMGLVHRWPHLTDLLGERLADLDVDAFAAGRQLSLDGAVEYARRTRGQRGRPARGWASLTPTEKAVVALVAEGKTNPQISEQLLMSRSTVKAHLSHVFAKLDVASRSELAALAARH